MGSRVEDHGGDMQPDTKMEPLDTDHCCACWRYTDDLRALTELQQQAVTIVVNGGTLAVENSVAFKAADAFLSSRFRERTPSVKPESFSMPERILRGGRS